MNPLKYTLPLLLLSLPAYARNDPPTPSTNAIAISGASASSSARSNVNVSNRVTSKQAQGQIQGQEASANNSGVNVTNERAIVAPSLGGFASGPCTGVGGQVSLGVAGFGGGAGFTALDEECTRRETARVLHLLGQTEAAIQLMLAAPILQSVKNPKTSADASEYCRRNPSDHYCK